MAIKIYTEKLYGHATSTLAARGLVQWIHNCLLDAGFHTLASSTGSGGAAGVDDKWLGGTITAPTALGIGSWCIMQTPPAEGGLSQICIGIHETTASRCGVSVSPVQGFNVGGALNVLFPPACNVVEDRVQLSQHKTTATADFASDRLNVSSYTSTSVCKLYLFVEQPDSVFFVMRDMSNGSIIASFCTLKLTGTGVAETYPYIHCSSQNAAALSHNQEGSMFQSYANGGTSYGLCQTNNIASPATKDASSVVVYKLPAAVVPAVADSPWYMIGGSVITMPTTPFSPDFIEEELLCISCRTSLFLRGKLPMIRTVPVRVPDGTISSDGMRATIGYTSFPWVNAAIGSTATMW